MHKAFWLLPILAAGCSVQKPPGQEAVAAPSAAPVDGDRAATASPAAAGEASVAAPGLLSAVRADAVDPGSVIHGYIGHLLRRESSAADAAWQFAPRSGRADDAALRALQDVVSLRVNTGSAEAADQRQPSHLIEVPVRVVARTAAGSFRYHGWYRLVPDAEGQAWRIQSAQLQPVLD